MDSNSQDQNKTAFEESNANFVGEKTESTGSGKPARRMPPALRVLTYVLAFLLGAGATVGAIVGTVVYGYNNVPVGSVLEKVYPNYRELLNEDFASNSVGGIIRELSSSNIQTLGDVRTITPCVDGLLDKLEKILSEYGIEADRTRLLSVRFKDLGTYFSEDLLRSARLDSLLSVQADSSKLEKYLAYGTEGEDYTVADGIIVMADGKSVHTIGTFLDSEQRKNLIDEMCLDNVIEVTEESELILRNLKKVPIGELPEKLKTLRLCEVIEINEASSQVLQSLKDTAIGEIGDRAGTLTLGEAVHITEDSEKLLQHLKDTQIGKLTDEIKNLTVGDMIAVDENSSHIVQVLQDTKVTNLNERLKSLTLGEALDVNENSPRILRVLAAGRLDSINEAVSALTMEDILGEEAFGHNVVLDALRLSRLDTVADDIEALTVNELFRDEIYDADGNVKGTWRYFLLEDGVEQQTYLKDINRISNRVAVNVNRAKLYDLEADRMITLKTPSDLEKQVIVDGKRIKLGDMTVAELVDHLLLFAR